MAVYIYECINKQGELVKGMINADSIAASVERLKNMGLSVIDLKEHRTPRKSSFLSSEKKVTIGDLCLFSRQLSAMISAGIPVTRALYTLSRQTTNDAFKNALETMATNIEGGMNLTDAFSQYPSIFPNIYVSMINSGELGGMLETSLERLADQLQKEKQLKDNIKSATFYPRMLIGFALLLFVGMLIFLVPIFQGFIPDGAEIPGITKLIFSLSESIRKSWYYWVAGLAAVSIAVYAAAKSPQGKKMWDRIRFKLPVFGELIQKSVIARFSRTFATLMECGIPVVQAMESAGPTSGSLLVAEVVQEATKRIEEGKNISAPLEESGIFPPMVTQMIEVGEETGSLPTLLEKVAEFYEEEVAIMVKGLTALIEPIMLVVVGIVVGGMLISLYLPIFSSITSARF